MDQLELERTVISHMVSDPRVYLQLRERGLARESFLSAVEQYDFIHDYQSQYSKLPSIDTLDSMFTGFSVNGNVDKEFAADLLLQRQTQRDVERILLEGISLLKKGETTGAIEYLTATLQGLRRPIKMSFGFTDAEAPKRVDQVLKRKELTKLMGGTFALPQLKYVDAGMMVGIIGRTGVGKSWMLAKLCVDAYSKGKRVLFISPEMTRAEVEARWDALVSKTFTVEALTEGTVPIAAYKEWTETVAGRSDWITFDSHYGEVFSPESISRLVLEYNPDIVAIDGVSLVAPQAGMGAGGDRGWEGVKEISYALQNLAVTRKVIVIATQQANRGGAEGTTPGLHHIAYGDAFGQACSVVLSMGMHENEKLKYLSVIKIRNARGIAGTTEIAFRPEEGVIA